MSAIQAALEKLDSAIIRAEAAAGGVEVALQGQQRDMFGAPEVSTSAANGESYIDGAVVAQKLDSTIKKMEQLLEDA